MYSARLLDDCLPSFDTSGLRVLEIKISPLKLGQGHFLKFTIPLPPVRGPWHARLHPGTMYSGRADPPPINAAF